MRLKNLMVLFVLMFFCISATPPYLKAETLDKTKPKAIKVAPPSPKFTDAERQAELAKRRKKVLDAMDANSVMILFSADRKIYSNDVDFYYRQENNLYYLTNLKQNFATLVLVKNGKGTSEYLFLPKRNPQAEIWNGKMYSDEDATKISGIKTIVDAREMNDFLKAFNVKSTFASEDGTNISNSAETLYLISPQPSRAGIALSEYPKEQNFASEIGNTYKIKNAEAIFSPLRLVKSPYEIKLMQHSVDITNEALMRSMAMIGKANYEYEVHAEVDYTFRRRNADYWGYPSIVGCGPNATTLHYVESQGEVRKGDLMLMDVGAEYDHYTADITRTFPVNGKFSQVQKDIYQIVYDAQEAAAKTIKPGATFGDPSRAATEVLREGLAKIGLITAPDAKYEAKFRDQTYQVDQVRLWYMHGWGHWLGMNVHDVGGGGQTVLKEGMIMTNEPGIYIREDALDYIPDTPANKEFIAKIRSAFEKYKNIGVRIEDDMLVTKTGVEWMSKDLPRSISDVEAFMAQASKEMSYSQSLPVQNPTFATLGYENELEWNPFISNKLISGKTMRSGYIWNKDLLAHSHSE